MYNKYDNPNDNKNENIKLLQKRVELKFLV
jgi:hypothetical protein